MSSGPTASSAGPRSAASEARRGRPQRRYFKRSYAEKLAVFPTRIQKLGLALLVLGIAVTPLVSRDYVVFLLTLVAITLLSALGLHVLLGLTGIISVGHAAFMAIGAYTATMLAVHLHWSLWLTVPLGGIAAAVASLLVAWPALRLRGFYVAMVTLAATFIVEQGLTYGKRVTGGSVGLHVPPLQFPWGKGGPQAIYYLAMVLAVLGVYCAVNLTRSNTGRALQAIRDRDLAAEMLGVPIIRHKVIAFVISSLYAGVAGGLMAINATFISPDMFSIVLSVQLLTICIVGGLGTVLGTIFGTIFMTLLPEMLQVGLSALAVSFPDLVSRAGYLRTTLFGLLIVLFTVFAPRGLFGLWHDIKVFWRQWPFSY